MNVKPTFANEKCFRYCPSCGEEAFVPVRDKEYRCRTCGFRFFFNACGAAVGVVTDDDGRILLTQRARDPAVGTWDLPGGFIDFEETAEQALRRELHEELNLTVDRSRYLFSIPNRYVFAGVLYRTIDLFFLCRAERLDTIVLKDGEIAACRFQRIEAIDVNDLGLESIQQGITLLQQKVADGEIWILP